VNDNCHVPPPVRCYIDYDSIGFPQISKYGIAFHLVFGDINAPPPPKPRPTSTPAFQSFEDDLLSYSYRNERLFWSAESRCITPVTVHFPEAITYVAEGANKILSVRAERGTTASTGRNKFAHLKASYTEFVTGVIILHLVLTPTFDSYDEDLLNESSLNEYEVVMLPKFWQGGEGLDVGKPNGIDSQVTFSRHPAPDVAVRGSFGDLAQHAARELFKSTKPATSALMKQIDNFDVSEHIKGGTIQVIVAKPESPQFSTLFEPSFFDTIRDIRRSNVTAANTGRDAVRDDICRPGRSRRFFEIRALQGILCGLMDFWDIGPEEIGDVFADPVLIEGGTFLTFHKGTLCSFSDDARMFDNVQSYAHIGISTYLILPQAVLLHNDYIMAHLNGMSKLAVNETVDSQELHMRGLKLRRELCTRWIPNIFHYTTERDLYDRGLESRGAKAMRVTLDERLGELDAEIAKRKAEDDSKFVTRMTVLGIAIGLLQVSGGWEALAKAVQITVRGGFDEGSPVDRYSIRHMFAAMSALLLLITLSPLVNRMVFGVRDWLRNPKQARQKKNKPGHTTK